MMDVCHIYFPKVLEGTISGVVPNVNYGLWVIIRSQCRLVPTNGPLWWGTLTMGETMHVGGGGVYGKLLYIPLNFDVNIQVF